MGEEVNPAEPLAISPAPATNPERVIDLKLPYAQALRYINDAKNRTFFLSVSQFAYAKDQEGVEPGFGQGRGVYANAEVTRKALLSFLDAAYSAPLRESHTVRIADYPAEKCLFVGSSLAVPTGT
jgi:hypothetical protein